MLNSLYKIFLIVVLFISLHGEEILTQKEFTIAFLSLTKANTENIADGLFTSLSPQEYRQYRTTTKYENKRKKFISKLQKTVASWSRKKYILRCVGYFGDYSFKKQHFRLRGIKTKDGEQRLGKYISLFVSGHQRLVLPKIRFKNAKKFRHFFVPLAAAKKLYDSRKYEYPMNRELELDIYTELIQFHPKKRVMEFSISHIAVFDEQKEFLSEITMSKK